MPVDWLGSWLRCMRSTLGSAGRRRTGPMITNEEFADCLRIYKTWREAGLQSSAAMQVICDALKAIGLKTQDAARIGREVRDLGEQQLVGASEP